MAREGRILVLCPLHSRPGEMVAAVLRRAGPDFVALCPHCIEDGRRIQEETGLSLVEEAVEPPASKERDGDGRPHNGHA